MVAKRWMVRSLSLLLLLLAWSAHGAERDLFDRDNRLAWCMVPFDAAHRGPAERGRMLEQLGLRQLADDWRAEHLAPFDAEVAAMQWHVASLAPEVRFWFRWPALVG